MRIPRHPILPGLLIPLLALLLAAWAVADALPPPPRGDEARHRHLVATAALRSVLLPWQTPLPGVRPRALQVARWGIPASAVWVVIVLVAKRVRSPLKALWIAHRGGHMIVAGLSPLGLRLLEQQAASGRLMIGADSDDRSEAVRIARAAGYPFRVADASTVDGLRMVGVGRARAVLMMSGRDTVNMAGVLSAVEAAGRYAEASRQLLIVARITAPGLRAQLESRVDPQALGARAQLRLFSMAALAARELLLRRPLDRFHYVGAEGHRHAVIIGFGDVGQEILLSILRTAHYRSGRIPAITIVDRDASRRAAAFEERFPGYHNIATPVFTSLDVEGERSFARFWNDMYEGGAFPTAIYICLTQIERALATGLVVEDVLRREMRHVPPIYVLDRNGVAGPELRRGLDGAGSTSGMIEPFGSDDAVFDAELVLQERLDHVAQTIHANYVAECLNRGETIGARPTVVPWEMLTETMRDDNRVVADHHRIKVRDAGYRLIPDPSVEAVPLAEDLVEELSRAEHDRWCAARWLSGWRPGPKRDDAARIHPDLVPYTELSEARKDLDRDIVRDMPRMLTRGGWGVVHPRIADAAGLSSFDSREGLLVRSSLLTPEERAACRSAVGRGAGLIVRLYEPTHAVLRSLPDRAARMEFVDLLASAETIEVAPVPALAPASAPLAMKDPT